MLWKIAHLQGATEKISEETAARNYGKALKSKGVTGLQLFAHRRLRKQMKGDFALKHYRKTLKRVAMNALLLYH